MNSQIANPYGLEIDHFKDCFILTRRMNIHWLGLPSWQIYHGNPDFSDKLHFVLSVRPQISLQELVFEHADVQTEGRI